MRRVIILALMIMGSAACATAPRWEKTGATEADRRRDETECASLASRESTVPSAQSSTTTPYSTPVDPQRVNVRPYDPTQFDECMQTRGYQRAPARPSS